MVEVAEKFKVAIIEACKFSEDLRGKVIFIIVNGITKSWNILKIAMDVIKRKVIWKNPHFPARSLQISKPNI